RLSQPQPHDVDVDELVQCAHGAGREVRAVQRDLATGTSVAVAAAPMPPPRSEVGAIGWVRHNLFSSWTDALLTVVALYVIWKLVDGILSWAVFHAVWSGEDGSACRVEGTGACWIFIKAKIGQFIYGRYPEEERWRVNAVFILAFAGLFPLMVPRIPGTTSSAGYTLRIFPVMAFWLLRGSASGPGAGLLDALGLGLAVAGIGAFTLSYSTGARIAPQKLRLAGGCCLLVAYPLVVRWLMSTSGLLDLPPVPTELWGGLLVTLVVASV